MADGIIGPLGAITTESIHLGFATSLKATEPAFVDFAKNETVLKFLPTCIKAAITDIRISCPGTVHAALIPNSWGVPAAKTLESTVGLCPAPCMTTMYTPHVTPFVSAFLTSQIQPAVLVGEPIALLLWADKAVTVNITFTFHRHGIKPAKPW
jgi:hypothetical protein